MNNNLIKLTTEKMFSPAVFTCSISPPRHSIFCLLQKDQATDQACPEMFVPPKSPKFCFNNQRIYHNMAFGLYYTAT